MNLKISLDGQLNSVIENAKIRILFLVSFIVIVLAVIAFKTVKLTFFLESEISHSLNKTKISEKFERRASILDRNEILISSSLVTSSVYANPRVMIDADDAALLLHGVLRDIPVSELHKKLTMDRGFIWIKRNLHPEQKQKINSLGIPGLYFEDEEKRIYPHGKLFSHVIGMVGLEGNGLTGMEKFLDDKEDELKEKYFTENREVKTTLDIRVQNVVRDEVETQMKKHSAIGGVGIVMDVTNGEILSLVSLPDYDPNIPSEIESKNLFGAATLGSYEMGSTFKPLTFAMGLELGLVRMNSVIDATDPIKISRFTISDFHPKKRPLSLPEALMYSSNIATAKIAEKIGPNAMQKYFRKLGLYKKLDVEVTEKSSPQLPQKWREVTTLTASYGHGLAVSPLHIVAAVAAVVNGGIYHQPTLLKQSESSTEVIVTGKEEGLRVFSESTSKNMRKLLRMVVSKGSGSKADAEGYFVGGKTGTAEKLSNGRYDHKKKISSFLGIYPMNDPKYAILVLLDEPKATKDTWGFSTGGWVSAPAVKRIIERISPILKVKPVDENDPKIKREFYVDYKVI